MLKGLNTTGLNGQRGTVVTGAAVDRVPVLLDVTKKRLVIKPENLELALPPVASAEAPARGLDTLTLGTHVVVRNQTANPINGERGVIRGWDPGHRKCIVQLITGATAILERSSLHIG